MVPSQYLVVPFGIKDDWDDEKEKLKIIYNDNNDNDEEDKIMIVALILLLMQVTMMRMMLIWMALVLPGARGPAPLVFYGSGKGAGGNFDLPVSSFRKSSNILFLMS